MASTGVRGFFDGGRGRNRVLEGGLAVIVKLRRRDFLFGLGSCGERVSGGELLSDSKPGCLHAGMHFTNAAKTGATLGGTAKRRWCGGGNRCRCRAVVPRNSTGLVIEGTHPRADHNDSLGSSVAGSRRTTRAGTRLLHQWRHLRTGSRPRDGDGRPRPSGARCHQCGSPGNRRCQRLGHGRRRHVWWGRLRKGAAGPGRWLWGRLSPGNLSLLRCPPLQWRGHGHAVRGGARCPRRGLHRTRSRFRGGHVVLRVHDSPEVHSALEVIVVEVLVAQQAQKIVLGGGVPVETGVTP